MFIVWLSFEQLCDHVDPVLPVIFITLFSQWICFPIYVNNVMQCYSFKYSVLWKITRMRGESVNKLNSSVGGKQQKLGI